MTEGNRADGPGLKKRVIALCCQVLEVGSLSSTDDLAELGLDSMRKLELLALLEKEFDVELTEDVIVEFQAVNRITRMLRGIMFSAEINT